MKLIKNKKMKKKIKNRKKLEIYQCNFKTIHINKMKRFNLISTPTMCQSKQGMSCYKQHKHSKLTEDKLCTETHKL